MMSINPCGEDEHDDYDDDVWRRRERRNSKQVYRWLQYTQNMSIDVGMIINISRRL